MAGWVPACILCSYCAWDMEFVCLGGLGLQELCDIGLYDSDVHLRAREKGRDVCK